MWTINYVYGANKGLYRKKRLKINYILVVIGRISVDLNPDAGLCITFCFLIRSIWFISSLSYAPSGFQSLLTELLWTFPFLLHLDQMKGGPRTDASLSSPTAATCIISIVFVVGLLTSRSSAAWDLNSW